jgi:hypothetical protein
MTDVTGDLAGYVLEVEPNADAALLAQVVHARDLARMVVCYARRLRETEHQRDELRDVVRGLEQALMLATSGRGTGARRCMVAEPADHCTGGYRAAHEEPDWRRAQRDFG